MKQQVLGTFFYMLYLVAMLQPIMPLIEYHANKEYIASVLCENRDKPQLACQGKCYLKKQVENSQEHDSHEHSLPQIDLSKYPISIVEYFNYSITESISYFKNEFFEVSSPPKDYINFLFRPPIS